MPELLRVEAVTQILYAQIAVAVDEGGEEGVVDTAVRSLAGGHATTMLDIGDGGGIAREEIPSAGVGAEGFGLLAEDLRRVAPRVEGDRNEDDPAAAIGLQSILGTRHLVGQQRAGVGSGTGRLLRVNFNDLTLSAAGPSSTR
jgi:hypothetical protein